MKLLVCLAHFTVVYVILIVPMPRSRQKIFYDFFLNVMGLTFELKDDPFIFSESEKHRVIEPFQPFLFGEWLELFLEGAYIKLQIYFP